MAIDFILATQPKVWERLKQHHGSEVEERFLKRLSSEIELRGTLDVLRNVIKDSGCSLKLAYFRPASGLNEDLQRLHAANLFTTVRQLRYSQKTEQSLDLVLFLNGIPIFTAELKNPLNGQNVEDAVRQYKKTRDPREPLFSYGRCLAHFAVDPDLVFVTTQLVGDKSWFLPFNQGDSAQLETRRCRRRRPDTRPAIYGNESGRGTACSILSANSSTKSKKRTRRAERRDASL
jgi:type I restriction enzyme, R subunit